MAYVSKRGEPRWLRTQPNQFRSSAVASPAPAVSVIYADDVWRECLCSDFRLANRVFDEIWCAPPFQREIRMEPHKPVAVKIPSDVGRTSRADTSYRHGLRGRISSSRRKRHRHRGSKSAGHTRRRYVTSRSSARAFFVPEGSATTESPGRTTRARNAPEKLAEFASGPNNGFVGIANPPSPSKESLSGRAPFPNAPAASDLHTRTSVARARTVLDSSLAESGCYGNRTCGGNSKLAAGLARSQSFNYSKRSSRLAVGSASILFPKADEHVLIPSEREASSVNGMRCARRLNCARSPLWRQFKNDGLTCRVARVLCEPCFRGVLFVARRVRNE